MSVSAPAPTGLNSSASSTGAAENRAAADSAVKPKETVGKTSAEDERRVAETGAIAPPTKPAITTVPALPETARVDLNAPASLKGRPTGMDDPNARVDRAQAQALKTAIADKQARGVPAESSAHHAMQDMTASNHNLAYKFDGKTMSVTREGQEIWSAPKPRDANSAGDWAARIQSAGNAILKDFKASPYSDIASPSAKDLVGRAQVGINGDIPRPARYRWPGYAPGA